MAYVGEMQYLTIGSNTYSLPSGGGGTVTSVAVSNATNGGLSISGSPVTSSGTITIGHSNILTSAQSTQAVYPITIDKNGHIASYGNAVTIPSEELGIVALYDDTYSDVSAAYNNYKYIIGYDGEGPMYLPLEKTEGGFTFTGIHKNGSDLFATEYTISSSGVWSNSSIRVDYMKWTASSSTNTYYPLVSSSASNTFTASTLNGINFYQYYNTAGGYRRLELGNTTAYKSTGGAYGTIRLYGAAATYYGDLVPGTLGTTSGDGHISANRTWTLPDATGTIALTSDIPTVPTNVSAFTNDAGYLTSYTETDPTVPSWAKASSKPSYTASEVGAAATSHAHGNITSDGDITATAPTIANGDQLVINDSSASKITNGPTFDGSTTSKYLSQKGTWESLPQGTAYSAGTGLDLSGTTFNHSNSVTAQTTQAVYPIKIDAQGHISAYGSAVTVPTITLNGSSTTSPSFYAPTSAGTSGYVLTSNGSGAPSWTSGELTDTKNTAGATVSSNKLYLIGAESIAANPQTYSRGDYLHYENGLYSYGIDHNCASTINQGSSLIILNTLDYNYSMQSTVDIRSNYISLLCEKNDVSLGQAEFEFRVNTSDALMSIGTTETLYTDIVALGWDSDVITT